VHTAPHDVADDDGQPAGAQRDHVVPVAPDLGVGHARVVADGDLELLAARGPGRQQRALQRQRRLAQRLRRCEQPGDVAGHDCDAAQASRPGFAERVPARRPPGRGAVDDAGDVDRLERELRGQHRPQWRLQRVGEAGQHLVRGASDVLLAAATTGLGQTPVDVQEAQVLVEAGEADGRGVEHRGQRLGVVGDSCRHQRVAARCEGAVHAGTLGAGVFHRVAVPGLS
jgi:uncharacterized protein YjlB